MAPICCLHVGQCGANIGFKFWEQMLSDHDLDKDGVCRSRDNALQIDRLDTFFNESQSGRFVPRALFVDTDPMLRDQIMEQPLRDLYNSEYCIWGNASTGCNFRVGMEAWSGPVTQNDGLDELEIDEPEEVLGERIQDSIRAIMEVCDELDGFIMTLGATGGTGSGLGGALLPHVTEQQHKIANVVSVMPTSTTCTMVETHNFLYSLFQYQNNPHAFVTCFDNESLEAICTKVLHMKHCNWDDLNTLIARTMSNYTAGMRFPGQININLRKMYNSLVPLPKLKLLMPGLAPLVSPLSSPYKEGSVNDLVTDMFKVKNRMLDLDLGEGQMMGLYTMFRGRVAMDEVDSCLHRMKFGRDCTCREVLDPGCLERSLNSHKSRKRGGKTDDKVKLLEKRNLFEPIKLVPRVGSLTLCDVAPRGCKLSSCYLANSTAFSGLVKMCLSVYRHSFSYGMTKDKFMEHAEDIPGDHPDDQRNPPYYYRMMELPTGEYDLHSEKFHEMEEMGRMYCDLQGSPDEWDMISNMSFHSSGGPNKGSTMGSSASAGGSTSDAMGEMLGEGSSDMGENNDNIIIF